MKITINLNYEKIPGKQLDEEFVAEKLYEALNEILQERIPLKDVDVSGPFWSKEEIIINVWSSK